MKSFLLCLMGMGAAHAADLVQLTQPALVGIGQAPRTACVGGSFNADGSIVGSCRTVIAGACSGRGCQPVMMTTNYVASWDANGNATGVSACSTVRHHLPQVDMVTYLNGHSAADCHGVTFNPTGTTVGIPYGPYAWEVEYFYYVSTDTTTGAELVNSNTAGYLYLPAGVTTNEPGKFY